MTVAVQFTVARSKKTLAADEEAASLKQLCQQYLFNMESPAPSTLLNVVPYQPYTGQGRVFTSPGWLGLDLDEQEVSDAAQGFPAWSIAQKRHSELRAAE